MEQERNDSLELRRPANHRFIITHYTPLTNIETFEDLEDHPLTSNDRSPPPEQSERVSATHSIPAKSLPELPVPNIQSRHRFTSLLSRLGHNSRHDSDSEASPKPTTQSLAKHRAKKSSSSDNTGTAAYTARGGVEGDRSRRSAKQATARELANDRAFERTHDERRPIRSGQVIERDIARKRTENEMGLRGYSEVIRREMARKNPHLEHMRSGSENERIRDKIDRNRGIPIDRHPTVEQRLERRQSLTAEEIFWGPKGAAGFTGMGFGTFR